MSSHKLNAAEAFPKTTVPCLSGNTLELGSPRAGKEWQAIIVYRGKHCPLCTKYLKQLKGLASQFSEAGVDVVVVSADTQEKAQAHAAGQLEMNVEVGYDLSIAQMQSLGLYISHPRSEQETDRPFAEPGLIVVNEEGNVHVIDISNNPFVRPDLEQLLSGLNWIRNPDNNYPIRGTYPDGIIFR